MVKRISGLASEVVRRRFLIGLTRSGISVRYMASHAKGKKEGDISSVFVSLSKDGESACLPERFAVVKKNLIQGHEEAVMASWKRLLVRISEETAHIARLGPQAVPQVDYSDLSTLSSSTVAEIKRRGVALITGVVPEEEARAYKSEVEAYVKANPGTKAFPPHNPQVYELYWSAPQIRARSHPNLIETQRFLMNLWHSDSPDAMISTHQPLSYADRLRIRQPGDAEFALGPHVDGGSVERWEPEGYGRGDVYRKIWQGHWEQYDPWESSCRLEADADLYDGAGACNMFRMFQGWLSMSHTGPSEGTLQVNPMLQLATAYFLLRPFFAPIDQPRMLLTGHYNPEYLDASNWKLQSASEMTSDLQGAFPGHSQELDQILHPHLELDKTMVHIPRIKPGDFVAWHCDTIHAVDKVHMGKADSSVIYIPVCPVTEANAKYLARQRESFVHGVPAPDFPGGRGESEHYGRPTEAYLKDNLTADALKAMGFMRLDVDAKDAKGGVQNVVEVANSALGF